METKVCTKCGQEKKLDEFTLQYNNKAEKKYVRSHCKVCRNKCQKEYDHKNELEKKERDKKYYESNKDKIIRRVKKYYPSHKDRIIRKVAEWAKTNPEKVKISRKKGVIELRDHYINHLLCANTPLKYSDIPPELVSAKREYIKLYRKLKGIQNENN